MRSRSRSHSSQLLHALPDGSRNTVGVTFSRNQVSLVVLSPSFWWPAVETPQRNESGKRGVDMGLLGDVGGQPSFHHAITTFATLASERIPGHLALHRHPLRLGER